MNRHTPTATDYKILDYLKEGHTISHLQAVHRFKTIMLRDSIYRLRKAGHTIEGKLVHYKNEEGKRKCYKEYSIIKAA